MLNYGENMDTYKFVAVDNTRIVDSDLVLINLNRRLEDKPVFELYTTIPILIETNRVL